MCGIAAVLDERDDGTERVRHMLVRLQHRGDVAPAWASVASGVLGCVRLRIVDRENGAQPFVSDTGSITVTYNGEIYNYPELRVELEGRGVQFRTDCDTEVLIHLYSAYGRSMVERLDGMFAFVLHDASKGEWFAARDRYGIKPLYWARHEGETYVASEMKAFEGLATGAYDELRPGHAMNAEGTWCYSRPVYGKSTIDSDQEVAKTIRALVEKAVQCRTRTDLPIGVFLGGGLDSAIVQMLCCKYHGDVTAIIVGKEDSSDVVSALRMCKEFGMKYSLVLVAEEELLSNVQEAVRITETFEPNVVRGALLSLKLAERASELGLRVVLCGEGSDELFAGYGDFLGMQDDVQFEAFRRRLFDDLYRTQLLRIDRTGMHYGVEVREPFMDQQLVKYAETIRPSLKVGVGPSGQRTTKAILRWAFTDMLPDYILNRVKATLMEGAGIGGVAREEGALYKYAEERVSDSAYYDVQQQFWQYSIANKEEALCFRYFVERYSKAQFAVRRVAHAQREIRSA